MPWRVSGTAGLDETVQEDILYKPRTPGMFSDDLRKCCLPTAVHVYSLRAADVLGTFFQHGGFQSSLWTRGFSTIRATALGILPRY